MVFDPTEVDAVAEVEAVGKVVDAAVEVEADTEVAGAVVLSEVQEAVGLAFAVEALVDFFDAPWSFSPVIALRFADPAQCSGFTQR